MAELSVRLVGDTQQFRQSLDAADRAVRKATTDIDKQFQRVAQSSGTATNRIQQQFRTTGQAIAVLDGPLGGVASRFTGLGSLIGSVGVIAGTAAIGITALAAAIGKAVSVGKDAEESQLRLQGVLKATGNAAGLTFEQIDKASRELGLATLTSANAARDAASALLTFRSVQGDFFTQTLKLAQDASAVFGGDLRSNVVRFGRALEDPIQGLSSLRRSGISFSESQKEVIKSLVETGEVAQAQGLVLAGIAGQIAGAAEAAAGGLTGQLDTLGEEINRFFEQSADSLGILAAATELVRRTGSGLGNINEGLFSDNTGEQVVELTNKVLQLKDALAELDAAGEGGGAQARGLRGNIERLEKRVEALIAKARVAADQGVADVEAARAGAAAAQAQALEDRETERLTKITAVTDKLKEELRLLEATNAERKTAAALAGKDVEATPGEKAEIQRINEQIDAIKERQATEDEATKAIEKQAAQRRELLATVQQAADDAARLAQAELQGAKAVEAVNNALEVEKALRDVGLSQNSAQGKAIADEINARQRLEKQIDDTTKAREREQAWRDSFSIFSQGAPRFDPFTTLANDNQRQSGEDARAEAEESARFIASRFEEAANSIQNSLAQAFADFRRGELDDFESFVASLGDTLASIPEQIGAGLLAGQLKGLTDEIQGALTDGFANGFSADTFRDLASNPLAGAALGSAAGQFLSSATGGNQQGAQIGSLIGSVAGTVIGSYFGPVGAAVGGAVGGAAGGAAGGLFGGGNPNDNAGATINLRSLDFTQDNSPGPGNQNRQEVTAIARSIQDFVRFGETVGLNFGGGSVDLAVSNKVPGAVAEERAVKALRKAILQSNPFGGTERTIARNTEAASFAELQQDLSFGATFDQFSRDANGFKDAVEQLNREYDVVLGRAEEFGLKTINLEKQRQKRLSDLADTSRAQIADLIGGTSLNTALLNLDRTFEEAAATTRALGISQTELNRARQRERASIIQAANDNIAGLQSQLGGIFQQRIDPLSGAIDSLQFGDTSALGSVDQLALLRQQFGSELAGVRSGSITDTTTLASLAQQVVGTAREAFASSAQFQEINAEVLAAVTSVRDNIQDQQQQAFDRLGDRIEISDQEAANRLIEAIEAQTAVLERIERAA